MQVSGNKYEKELYRAPAFEFCFMVEMWIAFTGHLVSQISF